MVEAQQKAGNRQQRRREASQRRRGISVAAPEAEPTVKNGGVWREGIRKIRDGGHFRVGDGGIVPVSSTGWLILSVACYLILPFGFLADLLFAVKGWFWGVRGDSQLILALSVIGIVFSLFCVRDAVNAIGKGLLRNRDVKIITLPVWIFFGLAFLGDLAVW